MKIQSFQYMLTVYGGNRDIEPQDLQERKNLLSKFKYSVIVEGDFMEFDNLFKWIKQNIGADSVEDIFYGKTDYDYGFAEFFIAEKKHDEKLRLAVPNIYTVYPAAYPSGMISKSDGNKSFVEYSTSDKNAIIYPIDEIL